MIKNREDYQRFLRAELRVIGSLNFFRLYLKTSFQPTHRFLLLLRTCEYLKNTKTSILYQFLYFFVKYLKYKQGIKLGFSIPENVVGEGLQLPHYGTIVINPRARLGKYCRIHVCVNIGASGGSKSAPKIGDYVYFAPGAKVYGDIEIADRVAIAANAVVAKSCLQSDVILGGVPAKVIGEIDIFSIIKHSAHSEKIL
jgi:serine O-acetyltransferase